MKEAEDEAGRRRRFSCELILREREQVSAAYPDSATFDSSFVEEFETASFVHHPRVLPRAKRTWDFNNCLLRSFHISIRYNWICLSVLMKPIFRSIFVSQLECVGFQRDKLIFRELFIFISMSNLLLNSPQFIFLFINLLPFDRCFIRIIRIDWRLLIFK